MVKAKVLSLRFDLKDHDPEPGRSNFMDLTSVSGFAHLASNLYRSCLELYMLHALKLISIHQLASHPIAKACSGSHTPMRAERFHRAFRYQVFFAVSYECRNQQEVTMQFDWIYSLSLGADIQLPT